MLLGAGYTPLHMAVGYSHVAVVNALLEAGASPEVQDRQSRDVIALVESIREKMPINSESVGRRMALEQVISLLGSEQLSSWQMVLETYNAAKPILSLRMAESNKVPSIAIFCASVVKHNAATVILFCWVQLYTGDAASDRAHQYAAKSLIMQTICLRRWSHQSSCRTGRTRTAPGTSW